VSDDNNILKEIMSPRKAAINAVEKADILMAQHIVIYCSSEFYEYVDGYYQCVPELHISLWGKRLLGKAFTKTRSNEIIHCIKTERLLPVDALNSSDKLNLLNGMLCMKTMELSQHDPKYNSSIRLNVDYDTNADCPRWKEVVLDMFEGDEYKLRALQEFFGLCLTKETKYQKSLILFGESGENGKSVVLYVLCELLGRDNYSAVSLEMFEKSHYVASLFGKLANISLETNTKATVYDSMFKAIVSGDPVEADRKYQSSFVFRPFCKLIFAMNTLPRVSDKTSAFFRRLLILKFNKKYKKEEQDINLQYSLVENELSGIFMWALQGLKRLRERGGFDTDMNMYKEVLSYQQENNNVLMFTEERCDFGDEFSETVADLYSEYKHWCEHDGYRANSKKNFTNEIIKHFKIVTRIRDYKGRKLMGIKLERNELFT